MAFTVVLLTLVACFMVDVVNCNTFCEGQDREKIVQALLGESQWETLAGFLGVGDGVLEGIWTHCGTRGSVSATCYRRQLVRHYCDKKAQACKQIASDMASILEHKMNNNRLAKELRQLFDIDIDDGHQPTDGSPPTDSTTPDPTDSTTPPPSHRDDNSRPSSRPYDGQSLGVWLTDNWVSLSLAATIVILSSVWYWCSKRKRESTAAEKLLNTANDIAKTVSKKVSSKKSSKEHSQKKTEKTAMDKKLGTNDLAEIMEFLVDVNKNWKELGLQLGLRKATLDGIEANYRDVKDCKREMMSEWLDWVDINYNPTWQHLADALRHSTVQHGPIAKDIEDEYSIILLD